MEDYIFCSSCGRRIEGDNCRLLEDGSYMCAECADEYCRRCDGCGGLFLRDGMTEEDGKYYCYGCWDDLYAECCICGCTMPREEIVEQEGRFICPECMKEIQDKVIAEPTDEPEDEELEEAEEPEETEKTVVPEISEASEDTVPEPVRDEAAPEKGKEREQMIGEIAKLEYNREYLMSQVLRLTDEIRELEEKLNRI